MNEQTVPDLYRLAFIPGAFECPKCGFALTKTTLDVFNGVAGTREEDRQSEPCPNDGTMMVHVTYKAALETCAERLKEELDRRDAFREELARFIIGLGFATWHGDTAEDLLRELKPQLSAAKLPEAPTGTPAPTGTGSLFNPKSDVHAQYEKSMNTPCPECHRVKAVEIKRYGYQSRWHAPGCSRDPMGKALSR